jgi:hypothetical protein
MFPRLTASNHLHGPHILSAIYQSTWVDASTASIVQYQPLLYTKKESLETKQRHGILNRGGAPNTQGPIFLFWMKTMICVWRLKNVWIASCRNSACFWKEKNQKEFLLNLFFSLFFFWDLACAKEKWDVVEWFWEVKLKSHFYIRI